MKRTIVATVAVLIGLAAGVQGGHAAGPAYLTFQFGRSVWQPSTGKACTPVAGSLTLGQVADDLTAHGFTGTGTVVVDRTDTGAARYCDAVNTYANWADLQLLQSEGWSFVSDGMTHDNMKLMTPAQQTAESCGSLPYFTANGIDNADAEFAYGDNSFTVAAQASIVSTCFDFGRTYQGGIDPMTKALAAPFFQRTTSITGGACNTVGAACYTTIAGQNGKHYMLPAKFIATLAAQGPDSWVDLQFYRIVTGVSTVKGWSWDCSSPDPTLHWTSQTEMYCQSDLDAIEAAVPLTTVVSNPAAIAAAWGREVS
jgi:hypothetical protein